MVAGKAMTRVAVSHAPNAVRYGLGSAVLIAGGMLVVGGKRAARLANLGRQLSFMWRRPLDLQREPSLYDRIVTFGVGVSFFLGGFLIVLGIIH